VKLRGATPPRLAYAAKPFTVLAAVFVVLIAADVVFAGRLLEDAPATAEGPAGFLPPETQRTAQNLPPAPERGLPAVTIGDPAVQCAYDEEHPVIQDLTPFTDGPYRGSADAPVRVIDIFDPNCPHCRDLAASIAPVEEAMGDKARFYYVAYP